MKKNKFIPFYDTLRITIASIAIVAFAFWFFVMGIMQMSVSIGTKEYYSERDNYKKIIGDMTEIYIYDDAVYFKLLIDDGKDYHNLCIEGKNFEIVSDAGLIDYLDRLKIVENVELISATRRFTIDWDAPVVEISLDDKTYLEFEEGFTNNVALYSPKDEFASTLNNILLGVIFVCGGLTIFFVIQHVRKGKRNSNL